MVPMKRDRLDVLILFLLLMARVRIDTLADFVLPTRHQDVARLPLVQHLFSPHALELLADWLTDPLSLVLISLAFAGFLFYLLADLARRFLGERWTYIVKALLIFLIIGLTIFANAGKLIALRQMNGPASYCHDGGVIQTEEAVKLFLAGRNPYAEDYVDTPLAEWGLDLRTAIYHYPYLPWTFVFSAPFYRLAEGLGFYFDERMIYLPLFFLTLLLSLRFGRRRSTRLLLLMAIGLNPIMGNDLIFGQNDSFVLFWMMLSLWFLPQTSDEAGQGWRYYLSAGVMGLAVASKPTAWFILPFYLLLLCEARLEEGRLRLAAGWPARLLPLLGVSAALIVPYLWWDPSALIDDVWRWSNGTSSTPYQIRGWGFSNFILALGLVESRLSYFPFWIPQLLTCLPLFAGQVWSQLREGAQAGAPTAFRHAGELLFVYAFFSRFLNENYIGFIASLLILGILGEALPAPAEEPASSSGES